MKKNKEEEVRGEGRGKMWRGWERRRRTKRSSVVTMGRRGEEEVRDFWVLVL